MLTVYSLVDKNEDFIELQYRSLKKFLKNDFNYLIFNNSQDESRAIRISEICLKLGIICIRMGVDYSSHNPSKIVANSLNHIWGGFIKNLGGITLYIDSDMFLVSELDIDDIMENTDILYEPQYRGDRNQIKYIWTGIFCFNNDTIDKNIDFSIGYPEGIQTDVGGMTHYFLKGNYKEKYIDNYHFREYNQNMLDITYNGCVREILTDQSEIQRHLETDYRQALYFSTKYGFPYFPMFDVLKLKDKNEISVFHFRSANWDDAYKNETYMTLKKAALNRMMEDLLQC